MKVERRFGLRETVELRARVGTPAGRHIEVVIKDLSDRGCRLEKPEYEIVPQRFTLRMPDGRGDMEAEIVWQVGKAIGVRFLAQATEAEPLEHLAPVRRPMPEVQKIPLSDLRRIAGRAG